MHVQGHEPFCKKGCEHAIPPFREGETTEQKVRRCGFRSVHTLRTEKRRIRCHDYSPFRAEVNDTTLALRVPDFSSLVRVTVSLCICTIRLLSHVCRSLK